MKPYLLPRLLLTLTLLAFACNAPFLPTQPAVVGAVLQTIAQAPALIPPAAYADKAAQLAQAIAELNRLQEETITHLQSSPPPEEVDKDLRTLSAASMQVAQMAE